MEQESPPNEPPSAHALVFFRPGTPAAFRRRRQIFGVLYLLAGSMVLWPIYPLFAAAEPRILGLPLSFAWVVGALLAIFAALLWLYLGDDDPRSAEEV